MDGETEEPKTEEPAKDESAAASEGYQGSDETMESQQDDAAREAAELAVRAELEASHPSTVAVFKTFLRKNIEWVHHEIELRRVGHSEEARAKLNP